MQWDKSRRETSEREPLLKVGDACREFGVSRDWVYKRTRAAARDLLPHARVGKLIRFEPGQVQDYSESRRKNDSGGTLKTTGGVARTNQWRYRSMVRMRFQKGYVRLRGKRCPY